MSASRAGQTLPPWDRNPFKRRAHGVAVMRPRHLGPDPDGLIDQQVRASVAGATQRDHARAGDHAGPAHS